MRMRTTIIGLLAGAVAASGGVALATTTGGGLSTGNVSLKVLAPTPNEVVTGPFLNLHVLARGYKLNDHYAGSTALAAIGHYHEILDGKLIDMTPLQGGNFDQISMTGVARGKHVLTLVPARNDHTMVMSKAVMIPFNYAGPYRPEPKGYTGNGKPSIAITSPANGATVSGNSFTMTVRVRNFVLCQGCFGKALVKGEGHWHVFEDAPMMPHMRQMAGTNTVTVPLLNYPRGRHTFYAVLVNNQHMPFMPMVMNSITLNVR